MNCNIVQIAYIAILQFKSSIEMKLLLYNFPIPKVLLPLLPLQAPSTPSTPLPNIVIALKALPTLLSSYLLTARIFSSFYSLTIFEFTLQSCHLERLSH